MLRLRMVGQYCCPRTSRELSKGRTRQLDDDERFALTELPSRAPLGLLWRSLSRPFNPVPVSAHPQPRSSDDPVFLPDFVALTPDQMQEILYRKGQDQ
jgi:hypothetical protein